MDKICDNNPTMNEIMEHEDGASECHENNNSNLKLICIENGAEGLGIKLSKSSWDPYPFISFVDETREQQHDLQIGDCLLKVLLLLFWNLVPTVRIASGRFCKAILLGVWEFELEFNVFEGAFFEQN